jgi:hypothetical protein
MSTPFFFAETTPFWPTQPDIFDIFSRNFPRRGVKRRAEKKV